MLPLSTHKAESQPIGKLEPGKGRCGSVFWTKSENNDSSHVLCVVQYMTAIRSANLIKWPALSSNVDNLTDNMWLIRNVYF